MFFACSGSMFFALMPELYRVSAGKNRGQTGEFPFSRVECLPLGQRFSREKGNSPVWPRFLVLPQRLLWIDAGGAQRGNGCCNHRGRKQAYSEERQKRRVK